MLEETPEKEAPILPLKRETPTYFKVMGNNLLKFITLFSKTMPPFP